MLKYRKRIVCLLLTAALLLSACSGQRSVTELKVTAPVYDWGKVSGKTITIWGDATNIMRPYVAGAFARYEELTGNTLQVVPLTAQEMDERVPLAFASDTAERPDLLLTYGGTNVDDLNPDENFYDFMEKPWIDDVSDMALNQAIYNGRVIGLPYGEASVSGTLYRKDIFKRYNLKVPTTQEEFLQTCEALLQRGITPMYLPYAGITMLLYQFPMDGFLQDQQILDGLNDGSLSYADIPEMRRIVEWYKTMADRGYFGNDYLKNDWDGMDSAMKSGKYGMMLCWDTWPSTNFTGDTTTLGLMPAFVGVPEYGTFEGPNLLLFAADRKSPNLDAALDFVDFLADPYNYNVAFEGIYTAPIFKNQLTSISTPQYMEVERLVEKLFCDSTAWLRIKGFSQLDAQYIQNYMQGACTLDECLRDMDAARIKRAGIQMKTATTDGV